jgi:FkbM family methyltransferase
VPLDLGRKKVVARQALGGLKYWLPHLRRLTKLAPSRGEGAKQTAVFLAWYLAMYVGLHPQRPFRMSGSYGDFLVSDHSQMLVILETVVDAGYEDPQLPDDVDLIIDAGCNIGASTAWFARRYPRAQIVAVEADHKTAQLAKHNLRGFQNVDVLHAAVSDRSGTASLWLDRESWASSTAAGTGECVTVPAVALDDLIERGGPRRLLKLDIEGAEHAVLRASERLGEVVFITGEYHPVAGASYRQLVDALGGFTVTPDAGVTDRRRTFIAWPSASSSSARELPVTAH